MKVVLYVQNLMDRGRFTAPQHEMVFVRTNEELASAADGADLVVMDLAAEGAIEALEASPMKATAYAGHVHEHLLNRANAIEGVEALPRSVFFRRLPQILNT